MKKQQGFTLIELIVVIVILGILAVTAAPKFLNIQGDARLSTLQGLQGAINGANTMLFGKAAIKGQEGKFNQTVEDVTLNYGSMAATSANIVKGVNMTTTDWQFDNAVAAVDGTSAGTIEIWPAGVTKTTGECSIKYTEATADTEATVELNGTADDC